MWQNACQQEAVDGLLPSQFPASQSMLYIIRHLDVFDNLSAVYLVSHARVLALAYISRGHGPFNLGAKKVERASLRQHIVKKVRYYVFRSEYYLSVCR